MIELSIKNTGDLHVRMKSPSPTVYLDHWALRQFSEHKELTDRLTTGVTSRNGTLAISWINLAEFTKVTVEEQARKAESLIEATFPRVFLLDVNPFLVIERENRLIEGAQRIPPHADVKFLKAIIGLNPKSVNVLSARDLFNVVRDEGSMQRFTTSRIQLLDVSRHFVISLKAIWTFSRQSHDCRLLRQFKEVHVFFLVS
jgi:hypothetical protein